MSLMAGFDLLIEMSNAMLLNLAKSIMQFDGVRVNPPFEIERPIVAGGMTGTVHIIVDNMYLDLNADDTVTFTFEFSRSSIISTSGTTFMASLLNGNFTITMGFQFVASPAGSLQNLKIDFSTAAVTITFDDPARIARALTSAGIPLGVDEFILLTRGVFENTIRRIPPLTLASFEVAPGGGSLSPWLRFDRVPEVHCIGNSDRDRQAVGVFGMLIAGSPSGDASEKTETAITRGSDIALSLSPGVFHTFLFCPQVATNLGAMISSLPATCGEAGGFSTRGVRLTSLRDNFTNGHINIDGSVEDSGFCYEANGTFHTEVTIEAMDTTFTPRLTPVNVDLDVDIPWYCWVVAGAIAGAIMGPVITGIVNAFMESIAEDIAESMIDNFLRKLGGTDIGGGLATRVSFSDVVITTEGLTAEGRVSISVPTSGSRDIELIGSVTTASRRIISEGILEFDEGCMMGSYPYTEFEQQQIARFAALPRLLARPVTLEWEIGAGIRPERVPLSGPSGTAGFSTVTRYPTPLPGGTSLGRTVQFGYRILESGITLTNTPADGVYSFDLYVRATDATGVIVQNAVVSRFDGVTAEVRGGYGDRLLECLLSFEWRSLYDKSEFPFPPDPPVERLIKSIVEVFASDDPQADSFLAYAAPAYGTRFSMALISSAATMLGLTRTR